MYGISFEFPAKACVFKFFVTLLLLFFYYKKNPIQLKHV